MTPQLFNVLEFLKYNERFWNEQLIRKAHKSVWLERAKELNDSHDAYKMDIGKIWSEFDKVLVGYM